MSTLICDLKISLKGHNLGFMQNLLHEISIHELKKDYYIMVPPQMANYFTNLRSSNIKLVIPTVEDWEVIKKCKNDFKRRLAEWKLIEYTANFLSVNEALIMDIDQYHYAIGKSKSHFSISGIYFRPHYRISSPSNNLILKFQSYVWKLRKRLYETWMCRNPSIKKIFILNDNEAVSKMNYNIKNIFQYLPDPIFDYGKDDSFNVYSKYNICSSRKIFLLFGSLSERKNAINIVNAFAGISPMAASRACLLIVGTIGEVYKNKLEQVIQIAKKLNPKLHIVTDYRFVENGQMESLFSQCDIALLLYKDLYVSSGVMGIAAKYNKFCLVSDKGLLSELVDQFQLGFKVAAENTKEISDTVEDLLQMENFPPTKGKEFYELHKPEKFAQILLESK